MNPKGFSNIALIVLTIIIAGSAVGYFYWTQRTTAPIEQTQTTNTQSSQQIPPTNSNVSPQTLSSSSETVDWKTYRNQTYGFELKYPPDLAIEFIATTASDQIAQFHIYDPNFDSSDKVGQEVRVEYSEVVFTIYHYTKESFTQKTKEYQSGIKEWNNELPKETITKSQSGDIKVYQLRSGLVGHYLQGHFHSDKYIFKIYAIFHDELANDILSTFKLSE